MIAIVRKSLGKLNTSVHAVIRTQSNVRSLYHCLLIYLFCFSTALSNCHCVLFLTWMFTLATSYLNISVISKYLNIMLCYDSKYVFLHFVEWRPTGYMQLR